MGVRKHRRFASTSFIISNNSKSQTSEADMSTTQTAQLGPTPEFNLDSLPVPEKRAYHSSFVHNKKLYIFGGIDLSQDCLDSLWQVDLSQLMLFVPGDTDVHMNPTWHKIKTSGISKPKAMACHTSVVLEDKMYLFGGTSNGKQCQDMYALDLLKFQWSLCKPKPYKGIAKNLPEPRDQHTCVLHREYLIMFGGYVEGKKCNTVYKYRCKDNTWQCIKAKGDPAAEEYLPAPRTGHAAVTVLSEQDGDYMYMFGGIGVHGEERLGDFWKLNLSTFHWTKILPNYGSVMGISEITRE